jgi:putative spermidine/putrescine transport system substrate-binding protein
LDGCDLGLLEPIDYGLMGGRDTLTGEPPTAIKNFFDLEKFPVKRGLYRSPKIALEWALLADSAPKGMVYARLSTPEGIEQAFKKLDTIKSETVWWTDPEEPAKLLIDEAVVMSAAWNGRIYDASQAKHKNLVMVWDAQGLEFNYWGIPKGAPHMNLAMRFIAFASQPQVQKNQSKYIPYGPTNLAAAALVPPGIHKNLPTATQNSQNVLVVDNRFWGRFGACLRNRFQEWLTE